MEEIRSSSKASVPLVVEFARGSRIRREDADEISFTVSQEVLPVTFVQFPDGSQVSIPTDQVVLGEDSHGAALIGFGGMCFEGMEDEQLVFWRVCDVVRGEYMLSGPRERMALALPLVSRVVVRGTQVWPRHGEVLR
jgi:hypothetical protein